MELVSMKLRNAEGELVSVDVPQVREGDVMDIMSNFTPQACSIILNLFLVTLAAQVLANTASESTRKLHNEYVTKALNSAFDMLDNDSSVN